MAKKFKKDYRDPPHQKGKREAHQSGKVLAGDRDAERTPKSRRKVFQSKEKFKRDEIVEGKEED